MSGRLRRVAASHLLVLVAVLVAGAGLAAGALVGFSAETQTKPSTYAGGWLDAPTGLQAPTVSGYGATLTWTPGTHDLTGQALYGTDQGTTSNCTGATYATQFATGLAKTLTTTTDSRGATANGHWICYQIQSTHGSWSTGANFAPVQVGLVPTGIAVNNGGGNSGQIENGDTIALSFNQNIVYSGAASISVCAFMGSGNGSVLIGDSTCAAPTDATSIGTITGLTIQNNSRQYPSSTASASGNTLTITLGGAKSNPQGRAPASWPGTFTYTGGSAIQSTAGSAAVCTAANCTWATSGTGF
ncbi:MAG TPA: hypothetical protein VFL60_09875 [Gaiellaceae bacterium]|nr:hypothetical protein [Gaiellaceae bacterium]